MKRMIRSIVVLAIFSCCFIFSPLSYAQTDDGIVFRQATYESAAENELALKQTLVGVTRITQLKIAEAFKLKVKRGAHAKGTCSNLTAEIEVDKDMPADLRKKVLAMKFFADGGVRWGRARVSNGSPKTQADSVPDARGLALKIGALGSQGSQDFIMINHPQFFAANPQEYLDFQQKKGAADAHNATPEAKEDFQNYMKEHDDLRRIIAEIGSKNVKSYATTPYWTGHAYKLGDEEVVKYHAKPCMGVEEGSVDNSSENFLQEDFAERASQDPGVCFELHIQFATSSGLTKEEISKIVENPTLKLNTETYKVATVQLHGPVFSDEDCDSVSFNPVVGSQEGMEGIGWIARLREVVYSASVVNRNKAKPAE